MMDIIGAGAVLLVLVFLGIAIAEIIKPSSEQDFWLHDTLRRGTQRRNDGHGWDGEKW